MTRKYQGLTEKLGWSVVVNDKYLLSICPGGFFGGFSFKYKIGVLRYQKGVPTYHHPINIVLINDQICSRVRRCFFKDRFRPLINSINQSTRSKCRPLKKLKLPKPQAPPVIISPRPTPPRHNPSWFTTPCIRDKWRSHVRPLLWSNMFPSPNPPPPPCPSEPKGVDRSDPGHSATFNQVLGDIEA